MDNLNGGMLALSMLLYLLSMYAISKVISLFKLYRELVENMEKLIEHQERMARKEDG